MIVEKGRRPKPTRFSDYPPELAGFVVSGLPSLSQHLIVIRVGASSDNELRAIRASAISRTKTRVTGDDDFVTFHHDE